MSVRSRIQMFQQAETADSSSPSPSPFAVNNNNTHNHIKNQQSGHKYSPKPNSLQLSNKSLSSSASVNINSKMNGQQQGLTNNYNCGTLKSKTSTMAINLSSSNTSDSATGAAPSQRRLSRSESNSSSSSSSVTVYRKNSVGGPVNGTGRVLTPTAPPSKPAAAVPPGQKPLLKRTTSIPKLISPVSTHNSFATSVSSTPTTSTDKMKPRAIRQPSFSGRVTIRNGMNGSHTTSVSVSNTASQNQTTTSSSRNQLYDSISWKDKYEESEKRRLHVVTLAQKATRDYEELRRRYNEVKNESDKVTQALDHSNSQLESLRQASEATYELYYKLKKKYEVENSSKSDALVRVDQYNKENRRLKRQSQVLMQQINDSNIHLEDLIELSEVGSSSEDNDSEIMYLRTRVQELESKLIDVESELEKTKLAEFETQESVMLMNDDAQHFKSENANLKRKIGDLEVENSYMKSSIDPIKLELEMLRDKEALEKEKLQVAEAELRKIQTEKNVLQRQSHVLLSANALDTQLLETLNTVSELQFALEEQRFNYETQIDELKNQVRDKTVEFESQALQSDMKIKTLEDQIASYEQRMSKMESALQCPPKSFSAPPAPPPPPPMSGCTPPPPPQLPSSGLAVQSVTLRRAKPNSSDSNNSLNGNGTSPEKSLGLDTSPQIDDLVSQLKKGIKLKPMDRTMSRKGTIDAPDSTSNKSGSEDSAVDEMKAILNRLKRNRTAMTGLK